MTTSQQTTPQAALDTALAYHRAWAGGDFEQAMTHLSPDLVCDTPAGTLRGFEAFRAFMEPFAAMAHSVRVTAAYGDDQHALIMYDASTPPVPSAPAAEWHTVADGLVVAMRIIFDRLPFEQARAAAS